MSQQKKELEQLIDRYVRGIATPSEVKQVQDWFSSVELETPQPSQEDVQRLKSRIDAVVRPLPRERRLLPSWRYRSVAATLVFALIALGLFLVDQRPSVPTSSHYAMRSVVIADEVQSLHVRFNRSAKNEVFRLDDGTQVTLTPGSSLRYVEGFQRDARRVALHGKGRFDVSKDASRPFSVITGDIYTTALGTVFWVRAPKNGVKPVVHLLSGKVEITQRASGLPSAVLARLSPGDKWNKGMLIAATTVAPAPIAAETEPAEVSSETLVLTFHHTPLTEVFVALEQHFDIVFHFDQSLVSGMTFYGSYEENTAVLEDILQHIALTNELSISYDESHQHYVVSSASKQQSNH